jgi:hypothetical protein
MNKSLLFPLICFVEMALQAIIIEFGNEALHVVERGLTINHWGFSLLFSCITFFISIIVKLIPLEKLIDIRLTKRRLEKERKAEEEIVQKNKILNEDAQSVDSIKDSAQIIIHKKGVDDMIDKRDETKPSKEKSVMSVRSNNKMKM